MLNILGANIIIFTATLLRVYTSCGLGAQYTEIQPVFATPLWPTSSLAQMLQFWTAIFTATCHSLPCRSITCCSWGVKWEELSTKADSPIEGTLLTAGLWPPLAWPPCGSLMPWLPNKRVHFSKPQNKGRQAHNPHLSLCIFPPCCMELPSMQKSQEERGCGWEWELCGFDAHSSVLQNQLLGNVPTNYTPHPPEEPQCIPHLN